MYIYIYIYIIHAHCSYIYIYIYIYTYTLLHRCEALVAIPATQRQQLVRGRWCLIWWDSNNHISYYYPYYELPSLPAYIPLFQAAGDRTVRQRSDPLRTLVCPTFCTSDLTHPVTGQCKAKLSVDQIIHNHCS